MVVADKGGLDFGDHESGEAAMGPRLLIVQDGESMRSAFAGLGWEVVAAATVASLPSGGADPIGADAIPGGGARDGSGA